MREIKRAYVTMRIIVVTTHDINDNSECKIYRSLDNV